MNKQLLLTITFCYAILFSLAMHASEVALNTEIDLSKFKATEVPFSYKKFRNQYAIPYIEKESQTYGLLSVLACGTIGTAYFYMYPNSRSTQNIMSAAAAGLISGSCAYVLKKQRMINTMNNVADALITKALTCNNILENLHGIQRYKALQPFIYYQYQDDHSRNQEYKKIFDEGSSQSDLFQLLNQSERHKNLWFTINQGLLYYSLRINIAEQDKIYADPARLATLHANINWLNTHSPTITENIDAWITFLNRVNAE